MINEIEDMTDEEQAAQALKTAIEHAQTILRLAENCYQKFGKQILSDTQKFYFQNVANGNLPTDEEQAAIESEQIALDMQSVIRARDLAKRAALAQGEAYTPEIVFQDRTDAGVN
jgi:hypothetical protein